MVTRLPPHIDEDTPIEERYLYPDPSWWGGGDGSELSEQDKRYLLLHQLADSTVAAITDNDADGLSTMAVIERAYGPDNVTHIESGHSNGVMKPADAMAFLLEQEDNSAVDWPLEHVYITDLCLDTDEFDEYEELIAKLSDQHTVHVYDHHQWQESVLERLRAVADDVIVQQDETVCATDITFQALRSRIAEQGEDVVDLIEDLAAVTRDNDLWIKNDPRSDDLSDFAFWADAPLYIETVREYGPNIMEDDEVAAFIEEERSEKQRRVELAVENADWYGFTRGEDGVVTYEPLAVDEPAAVTVALAYGDVYASEVGNQLTTHEPDSADIAVIVQPWNKVSIRGSEAFAYCDEIASLLGGGGHPTAAGCTTDILGASGSVSYDDHWRSHGAAVKRTMLETIRVYLETNPQLLHDVTEE